MLLGLLAFGMVSGLLAAAMVMGSIGSIWLALLAYSVFGSLGAVLYAVAMATRAADSADDTTD